MSIFFRSVVGAAMLMTAGATVVKAQDYTWTLSDFAFGDWYDGDKNIGGVKQGTEQTTSASGTLVLSKVVGGYALKSFNFTTTADPFFDGTAFMGTYDSSIEGGYGTDTSPAFDTNIEMVEAIVGDLRFHLQWDNAALADEMGVNNLGAIVNLTGEDSYEYDNNNFGPNGSTTRYSRSDHSCPDVPDGVCGGPGVLTLSGISNVPEPASMALLGTGLLGLLAARRRKTA